MRRDELEDKVDPTISRAFQVEQSKAISLKRIADALQRIAERPFNS